MRYKGLYLLAVIMALSSPICQAATDTVMVVDFNFLPPSLTVAPGDTVLWIVAPACCIHTVTRAVSPAWDSGPLTSGGEFKRAFPVCGTFNYFCSFHQIIGMVGAIDVVGGGAPIKGDMNASGGLTSADAVLMLNCVFLASGICDLCFADVNCSSDLTSADAVLELNAVFLALAFPC